MYQPVEFRDDAAERAYDHVRRNPLGILVSAGTGLAATHTPMLVDDEAAPTGLVGHCAIRNEALTSLEDGARVLAIFPGAHAYVHPSLYHVDRSAPTVNYTAVHVSGTFHRATDAELHTILKRTVAQFESDQRPGSKAWTVADLASGQYRSMIRGIIGFRIVADRVEGGYKLSQNKAGDDVRSIEASLAGSGDSNDHAVAQEMRATGMIGRTGPSSTDPNVWLGPL
ncbi:transcriptional regulator [Kineosphaera limosa]|uniref:Putative transcriptional regulator n=1 Tax=Kineosphaera limosa NBRC 100340 TaxID=1184609 RepID=K6VKB0_9MICO|nr:FMN-binding negative transcriptional regulator [Kineosphaera limosa]NYD99953.1 transcriptional regulator [Kineosphaera limosa]GAB96663.1 putative transcriptional regulator [Kineosphaera limosa NBRC 100340]